MSPENVHYGPEDLEWIQLGEGTGWERASVMLGDYETAWNPASTKLVIYGPAVVTYERGPDGGVSAYIED